MALNEIIDRKEHTWWQKFVKVPHQTLAQTLYTQRQRLAISRQNSSAQLGITVVCISDTHNSQPILPAGDLLVHAGDLTQGGSLEEVQYQLDWLDAQPHTHKVVIAGNHDIALDRSKPPVSHPQRDTIRWGSVKYLEKSATTLNFPTGTSLCIFGHPETRKHGNWAFQFDKGTDAFSNRVDDVVDILVTHSPPQFHLDVAGWGDFFLLRELWRVRPRLHVFGHVHEGYGRDILEYDRFERLYENVRLGSAGILALFQMMLLLVGQLISKPNPSRQRTILVNAAYVGGLLDERGRTVQVVRL